MKALMFALLALTCLPAHADLCSIGGNGEGYSMIVAKGLGQVGELRNNIDATIAELNKAVHAGACTKGSFPCSIGGGDGYSAVYIDGRQATGLNSDLNKTIVAFNKLKAEGVCRIATVHCQTRQQDGFTAVLSNGKQITQFSKSFINTKLDANALLTTGACGGAESVTPAPQAEAIAKVNPPPSRRPVVTGPSASSSPGNLLCWKGYTQGEQDNNEKLCLAQREAGQQCAKNWNVHKQGLYDVCLRNSNATHVVACFKGYSQSDQNKNVRQCESQVAGTQVCESNWNAHQHGVYDVCIMDEN